MSQINVEKGSVYDKERRSTLVRVTFSHLAVVILFNAGIALFYASSVYSSRDKRPYWGAQMITLLAMAIALMAVDSFYFMDLLGESWAWIFFADVMFGFGLLNVLMEVVNRFPNASPRERLFVGSAIGIAMIVVYVVCFLRVRNVYTY